MVVVLVRCSLSIPAGSSSQRLRSHSAFASSRPHSSLSYILFPPSLALFLFSFDSVTLLEPLFLFFGAPFSLSRSFGSLSPISSAFWSPLRQPLRRQPPPGKIERGGKKNNRKPLSSTPDTELLLFCDRNLLPHI
ncbi:uncharacterized protein BO80DRAFT_195570 [Aspergillus ibericus CBS 121593]|uniref:Uncharacterized protein n=1 Tax=Aspergillus ibericus CBS 121593 TaxID=1448316 RepID=A0A395GR72_9EURO|nr:hypothetical protein BO80DRAFT_195570 [Aspergillus ibericus CBS 121593]RAK97227.1 hypothetical protein BO80DRAFT_195570 [Aspergillus ibericus CBS 121593]